MKTTITKSGRTTITIRIDSSTPMYKYRFIQKDIYELDGGSIRIDQSQCITDTYPTYYIHIKDKAPQIVYDSVNEALMQMKDEYLNLIRIAIQSENEESGFRELLTN